MVASVLEHNHFPDTVEELRQNLALLESPYNTDDDHDRWLAQWAHGMEQWDHGDDDDEFDDSNSAADGMALVQADPETSEPSAPRRALDQSPRQDDR